MLSVDTYTVIGDSYYMKNTFIDSPRDVHLLINMNVLSTEISGPEYKKTKNKQT